MDHYYSRFRSLVVGFYSFFLPSIYPIQINMIYGGFQKLCPPIAGWFRGRPICGNLTGSPWQVNVRNAGSKRHLCWRLVCRMMLAFNLYIICIDIHFNVILEIEYEIFNHSSLNWEDFWTCHIRSTSGWLYIYIIYNMYNMCICVCIHAMHTVLVLWCLLDQLHGFAPVHVHTTEEMYVNVSSMGAFSPALRGWHDSGHTVFFMEGGSERIRNDENYRFCWWRPPFLDQFAFKDHLHTALDEEAKELEFAMVAWGEAVGS